MPTKAEFIELLNSDNCTWTWTTKNEVNGYKVTSKKTGNSIFLPAAGWRDGRSLYDMGQLGHYWSSTSDSNDAHASGAYYLDLYSDYPSMFWFYRNFGQSVRPVSE